MLRSIAATTGLLVVLWTSLAQAAPCAGFTDVDDSSPFCVNVEWMKNRGITLGVTATQYRPNDPVTRLQMAAFMYRLGFQNAFLRDGNAFGATAILGTTDNQPLDIRVNDARVMRYEPNAISPNVIGGSPTNNVTAGVRGATIAGGGAPAGTDPDVPGDAPNRVTDAYGTVGGGFANVAGNDAGTTIDRTFATVGGGLANSASGTHSTVAGGNSNTASGSDSTVAGGVSNIASGTVSTVPGGVSNTASGLSSFAAGFNANANANGCFAWGDSSTNNEVSCAGANTFVVRSTGGVFFISAGTSDANYTGVLLLPGATAWVASSDRRLKENLHTVDTRDVLDKLLALPITTWNLKTQDPSIRHMGAMAQDFRAAFGLGETELGISTLDADGVALAAIQGLNAKLEATVAEQAQENARLHAELADLRSLKEEVASIRAAQFRDSVATR